MAEIVSDALTLPHLIDNALFYSLRACSSGGALRIEALRDAIIASTSRPLAKPIADCMKSCFHVKCEENVVLS